MEKTKKILISVINIVLPILFALVVGAVFIAITGKNPLKVYAFLI